jgi:uncharacterized protein (TIGR03435 family)
MWGTILLAVANHLWQSTLFAAAIASLALVLRNNHASTRYWLWFAASLKFLLPFSLLVFLGSHLTWLPQPLPHHDAGTAARSYLFVEEISQPFTQEAIPWVATKPAIGVSESIVARIAAFLRPIPLLPAVVAAVWICGSMFVLGLWISRWLRIRGAIRKARPVLEGREVDALRRVEHLLGLRRRIELRLFPALTEPGIFGMVRPVLLWPQAISARLDEAQLDAVLAHEVWHVRRQDNLTAAVHMLVEAIFWFHPLLWWLETRLVGERESACDEEIARRYSQPQVYAESILKVCEFCVESPLACVSGITGADLKRRVRSIMAPRFAELTLARKIMLAAFALLTIGAPMAFGVLRMTPIMYGQVLHASGPLPSFEVATIKPFRPSQNATPPPAGQPGFPDTINISVSARMLIQTAYNIPIGSRNQIVGGPSWMDNLYEIHAKIGGAKYEQMQKLPNALRREQTQLMLRSLLIDRFKLTAHIETREMPVYGLVVAKGGPKLTAASGPTRLNVSPNGRGGLVLAAKGATIDDLVYSPLFWMVQELGGRTVINQTGLSGTYDFGMQWEPERPSPNAGEATPQEPGASSFSTALQEQLGLRLVSTKGPVEVVVIDQIEPPSEN